MKKKKLLSFVLSVLALPLTLVSCGDSNSTSTQEPTPTPTPTPSESVKEETNVVTIAEAINLAKEAGDSGTEEMYQVSGKIVEVSNAQYGAMTIKDETGELYVYGVYGKDQKTPYSEFEEKPVAGDDITLLGKLKTYNGEPEMDRGYMQSFTHNDPSENIDLTQYTEKTILQARDVEDDSKIIVSGTVTAITYAFGMKPNGFYLTDNESSIYVYGSQAAPQVKVGNKVKVAAIKDYYILESEQSNANKHGYKGSNQLAQPTILENDKGNSEIDLSWAQETTIKDIMDTPVSDNITTNIFKVNALVNKVEGTGFVNYYFNDIDGYTGSYAYSQCSGSDFAWLDEFHGKICTVYISPINCKSTPSESFYRFVPIKVSYDNYTFDVTKAPEFALKYYVSGQFKELYEADPELEVKTSVSSELLGLSNISLSYTSNNENVVYFENVENKYVMHTKDEGKATVSVTATYQTYSLTQTYEITVQEPVTYETISVAEAIATVDGTEVTVQGVVLSSLVNKVGFYIYDETGIIAVQMTAEELAKVEIGNMVVIKGTRAHNKKAESTDITGQSNLKDATVLVNLYGKHEYSTEKFDSSKTFADLYALDKNVDYSTTPFIVKGKLEFVKTSYYTTLNFKSEDGSSKLTLYMSGAGQYSCFEEYYNQVLTFEIIPTNWNDKSYWTFCIIAIITEDGKVMNSSNWYAQ